VTATTTRKTIVWDLDDVLNNLMEAWLEKAWQIERPDSTVVFAQLEKNPPHEILAATSAEYLHSLDRFRLSKLADKLLPHPAVLKWFQSNGDRFHHHVLTARPVSTVAPASSWVFTHFGRWTRHFHFVPSPRSGEALPAYETSKAEVLAKIGPVDFFIDDSSENVAAASALGIRSFIFPQPWNSSEQSVPEILNELSHHASK
jgi:FMN phosphatase YigB (HAD superfamily)